MSIEVYEEIIKRLNSSIEDSREELYRLLAEGRTAAENGRTRPHKEVMADIERRIVDGTL